MCYNTSAGKHYKSNHAADWPQKPATACQQFAGFLLRQSVAIFGVRMARTLVCCWLLSFAVEAGAAPAYYPVTLTGTRELIVTRADPTPGLARTVTISAGDFDQHGSGPFYLPEWSQPDVLPSMTPQTWTVPLEHVQLIDPDSDIRVALGNSTWTYHDELRLPGGHILRYYEDFTVTSAEVTLHYWVSEFWGSAHKLSYTLTGTARIVPEPGVMLLLAVIPLLVRRRRQ